MGRKIFISYKYGDDSVKQLGGPHITTARDYVNILEVKLSAGDHILKCESEHNDLSGYTEDTIRKILSNRIFDSTVTIVLASPQMKDRTLSERNQWIPWEISYSMRKTTRTSKSGKKFSSPGNGLICVVLPDKNGRYDYVITKNDCCRHKCTAFNFDPLFKIIRRNAFNTTRGESWECENGLKIYSGNHSYISIMDWDTFLLSANREIENAWERCSKMSEYDVAIELAPLES